MRGHPQSLNIGAFLCVFETFAPQWECFIRVYPSAILLPPSFPVIQKDLKPRAVYMLRMCCTTEPSSCLLYVF